MRETDAADRRVRGPSALPVLTGRMPAEAASAAGVTLLTVDVEPDWGVAAGPDAPTRGVREALPRLLEELERRAVRATFFVTGELAELFAQHCGPRGAHEVGAHGLTHRRLSRLSPADLQHELVEARRRLAAQGFDVAGFRAPFLDAPAELRVRLARAGYRYDASGGALHPSRRNRAPVHALSSDAANGSTSGSIAALASDAVRGMDAVVPVHGAALRGMPAPANLTWLRLLDPLGVRLLPRRLPHFSLHLHELLPAREGLASLPWPLRRLHARGCGARAWSLLGQALDRARDDGCSFLTCSEALAAAERIAGASQRASATAPT